MRFEKTREVLNHAKEFHNKVSALYQRLADKADERRVKMMFNYMSQHETALEKGLAEYEEESPDGILETWFQFTHDEETLNALQSDVAYGPDVSMDDAIDLAMKFDGCLMELYKETARNAETKEVSEMFVSLLELEKQEARKLVRNALMAEDI